MMQEHSESPLQADDPVPISATADPLTDFPPQEAPTEAPHAAETSDDGKYQELHDQHLRLAADFENFRKRVLQEREALLKYGAESTVEKLLPILDNLDRATTGLSAESDPTMLFKSFELLSRQLLDTLSAVGLKKVETVGHPFDPKYHEAISQVVSADHAENEIVSEAQSGFMLHDRLLRPALVVVAASQADPTPDSTPETSPESSPSGNPFASAEAQNQGA